MSLVTNSRYLGFQVGVKGELPLVAVEDPCHPTRKLGVRVGAKSGKPAYANGPCDAATTPTIDSRYHGIRVGVINGVPLVAMRCENCVPTCASGRVHFSVSGCRGGLNDAVCTVTKGAFSDSCTTATSLSLVDGYCTIDLGSEGAGTYNYTITHPSGRFQNATGSFTLASGSCTANAVVSLTPVSGYVCTNCCNLPLPETLYLDDKFGVTDLTYDAMSGIWTGCNTSGPVSAYKHENTGSSCEVTSGGLGNTSVRYRLDCVASGVNVSFTLTPFTTGCGGGATTPPGAIYVECDGDSGTGCSSPAYFLSPALACFPPSQSMACENAVNLTFAVPTHTDCETDCADIFWASGDTFTVTE